MADLKGTRTHESLKRAFSGEAQANRRYVFFARVAESEGLSEIAGLFRDLSEEETGHALGHLERLREAGDPATDEPMVGTRALLASAIIGETYEAKEMYPKMAQLAHEEGFPEIARWFERLARAEKAHVARFRKALDGLD